MLRQTAAFFLIRAENLPGIIVVSALRRGYFRETCRGQKEAKWREHVQTQSQVDGCDWAEGVTFVHFFDAVE